MAEAWQRVAVISPGGTVLGLALRPCSGQAGDAEGDLLLATGAGLFRRGDGVWQPLAQGQPIAQLSTLISAGGVLFAGGHPGEIAYSTDGGATWAQGRLRQAIEPVTCLAASPAFQQDGVVLAGTHGTGILRSTDGGRHWQSSSFGLQDFSVLALAAAPVWGRREPIFAGTTQGLYRSPNGGRAWKRVNAGIGDSAVQCIAVSSDLSIILAGTETRGLLRSTDGGKRWQAFDLAGDRSTPINCLWLHPDFAATPTCLAGTGDGQIWRSVDGGTSWSCVAALDAPILCLASAGQHLFAGLHDEGLVSSADGGQTWASEPGLAARAVTRLALGPAGRLFAWGPWERVWCSADRGETWAPIQGLDESSALLALASSVSEQRPCLLVGTTGGLQQSNDGGQTWRQALAAGVTSIVFSPQFDEDGRIWVGTDSGELLVSQDGALDWTHLAPPQPGVPLVALAVRPGRSSAEILLAATLEISERRVNVWRSSDGGQTWESWMQEAVDWPSVHLVLSGQTPGRAVVCIDRTCWQAVPPDWQPARCVETDRPIVRMSQATEPPEIVLLAPGQMLCSGDGLSWSALDGGLGDWDWVDVNLAPSTASHHIAYALSRGGVVWCRAIPKGPYRLEQKEMP